ncbi:MAG: hypothetical protein ACJAUH_002627 [Saprospiraceae bacterium]|jgi:hypothetical protein
MKRSKNLSDKQQAGQGLIACLLDLRLKVLQKLNRLKLASLKHQSVLNAFPILSA